MSLVHAVDLVSLDIHPEDPNTHSGEACRGNRADIAETEYADSLFRHGKRNISRTRRTSDGVMLSADELIPLPARFSALLNLGLPPQSLRERIDTAPAYDLVALKGDSFEKCDSLVCVGMGSAINATVTYPRIY